MGNFGKTDNVADCHCLHAEGSGKALETSFRIFFL